MLAPDNSSTRSRRCRLQQRKSRFEINDLARFEAVSFLVSVVFGTRFVASGVRFDEGGVENGNDLRKRSGKCARERGEDAREPADMHQSFPKLHEVEWSIPDMLSGSRYEQPMSWRYMSRRAMRTLSYPPRPRFGSCTASSWAA